MSNTRPMTAVLVLALSGCAPQADAIGFNTVAGHARLDSKGKVRGCEDVMLLPAAGGLQNRLAPLGLSDRATFVGEFTFRPLIADERIERSRREADCDADGAFSFKGVPPGPYYLAARITWSLRGARHGGYVIETIAVDGRATDTDIAATKDDA